MSDPVRLLLADTVPMLVQLHRDAVSRDTQANPEARSFDAGRRLALYEALSLLYSQAQSFGLSPTELGFPSDFVLDRDLPA
jgi:hypothetical protein